MIDLICALPFAAALLNPCAPPGPFATGYVEGDYTLIAPVAAAQIEQLHVRRGDAVQTGDLLVSMQSRDARIALSEAEAALARAESQAANLTEGKREAEIRVIEAALASATAQVAQAEREAARYDTLVQRGAATQAQADDADTAADVARAKRAEIEANLAVARLPARPQEIAAAKATVDGARAARDQAAWNLEQRALHAPGPGRIADVIRIEGEIAGPTAPVLSFLGTGAVKLRLYVPETQLARIGLDTVLDVHCDGCAEGLTARVTYIADGPEFTPPVIYSLESRQKLVYLIEARPTEGAELKPGQIIDVALPDTPQ
ncbi:HlyD family secretion protein [Tropicibacter sp. S64]|uniref:HlyD family secretion protein n=1 Tax=Tropicibacter sp. S64 TaxID=3415122 RepID=UPI003C7C4C33